MLCQCLYKEEETDTYWVFKVLNRDGWFTNISATESSIHCEASPLEYLARESE